MSDTGQWLTVKPIPGGYIMHVIINGMSDRGYVVTCDEIEDAIYEMWDALNIGWEQVILYAKVPVRCDREHVEQQISDFIKNTTCEQVT